MITGSQKCSRTLWRESWKGILLLRPVRLSKSLWAGRGVGINTIIERGSGRGQKCLWGVAHPGLQGRKRSSAFRAALTFEVSDASPFKLGKHMNWKKNMKRQEKHLQFRINRIIKRQNCNYHTNVKSRFKKKKKIEQQ